MDLLLKLGGDLSRVNVVGNDLVAIAASAGSRGLWGRFRTDMPLLARCTAKHAGRVALQLFADLMIEAWAAPHQGTGTRFQLDKKWCGELLDPFQPFCIAPLFQVHPFLC